MEFTAFKDWALLGLLTGGIWILYSLKGSVERLNVKMAVMIERYSNHENRIRVLERKKK